MSGTTGQPIWEKFIIEIIGSAKSKIKISKEKVNAKTCSYTKSL